MMDISVSAETIAILTGVVGLLAAYTTGTVKLTRRLDKIERGQKRADSERPKRKKEVAMIFRYMLSMHDGMRKCGYVNGELEAHRKVVEKYIDDNWNGPELSE